MSTIPSHVQCANLVPNAQCLPVQISSSSCSFVEFGRVVVLLDGVYRLKLSKSDSVALRSFVDARVRYREVQVLV